MEAFEQLNHLKGETLIRLAIVIIMKHLIHINYFLEVLDFDGLGWSIWLYSLTKIIIGAQDRSQNFTESGPFLQKYVKLRRIFF